jgi:hypothetical protein
MSTPLNIPGIYVPSWAKRTIPKNVPSQAMQSAVIGKQNPTLRSAGGYHMPSGRVVLPYQDTLVPLNEKINPVQIEPEMYPVNGYAYYNMAFNSQSQPTPQIVSSSGRFATVPVNYSQGMYAWVNPAAGRFR